MGPATWSDLGRVHQCQTLLLCCRVPRLSRRQHSARVRHHSLSAVIVQLLQHSSQAIVTRICAQDESLAEVGQLEDWLTDERMAQAIKGVLTLLSPMEWYARARESREWACNS